MEQKINIAKLLKDCPKGIELDCLIYDNLYFDYIREHPIYPIICWTVDSKGNEHEVSFNWYGKSSSIDCAKCVIFPKGKTTWEGFIPTCKFKDGDVCYVKTKALYEYIFIFKVSEENVYIQRYVNLSDHGLHTDKCPVCTTDKIKEIRNATEEEKQKLFKAIKDNGYYWNDKTKTLDKLVEPKFKVGDRVRNKRYKDYIYTIHDIVDKGYSAKEIDADYPIIILFGSQEDNYELVPNKFEISTLEPFESKVLVRDCKNEKWKPACWGFYDKDSNYYPYNVIGGRHRYCIPYEGNEHLLGITDDCDDYYKDCNNFSYYEYD